MNQSSNPSRDVRRSLQARRQASVAAAIAHSGDVDAKNILARRIARSETWIMGTEAADMAVGNGHWGFGGAEPQEKPSSALNHQARVPESDFGAWMEDDDAGK